MGSNARVLSIPAVIIERMGQRAAALVSVGMTNNTQLARALVESWIEGVASTEFKDGALLHPGRPIPREIWLAQQGGVIGAHVYTSFREAERMTEGSLWEPCGPYVKANPP